MNKISRRALAKYAVDQLTAGEPANQIAKHLAGVLVGSRRADQVDFLLGDIAWELERRGAVARVKVVSANPLTLELEAQIKSQIKKAANTKDVLLENDVDKSIIGGLRVETTAKVWDTTIKRQLTELKESV